MRRMLVVMMLMASTAAMSDDKTPLPVYLFTQCDNDSVGQRLAFKIRESIRRASSMTLADRYTDSPIQMSLVCLNPDSNERGSVSRYSYSITFLNLNGYYDYQLTHGVGTCGARRVEECAENLVADIDVEILKLTQRIADGSFNPF